MSISTEAKSNRRSILLPVLYCLCCLGMIAVCAFIDLISAGRVLPIYLLLLAAMVAPSSLLLISIRSSRLLIAFCLLILFLTVLPFLPWTPEKRFLRKVGTVKEGMVFAEVEQLLSPYRLRDHIDEWDGSRTYFFDYPGDVGFFDDSFSVTVLNGKVVSFELDED